MLELEGTVKDIWSIPFLYCKDVFKDEENWDPDKVWDFSEIRGKLLTEE